MFINIFLLFAFVFTLNGQTRVIEGKVITLQDLPVANFEIHAKKSGAAIQTDSLGRFSIATKPKDVLLFKGKVFKNKRVRINDEIKDSLIVQVEFIPTPENEKRAIGYGYVSKDDLLNSVSHMDRRNADFCNYANIYELIRGRFPGVQVKGSGANAQVIIRGQNSLHLSSDALYVVDGVTVSSIFQISPCDVKSIDVIKDGGSSIYGSRGANGVVIIETLKGTDVIE